jgi:hypothetical protein
MPMESPCFCATSRLCRLLQDVLESLLGHARFPNGELRRRLPLSFYPVSGSRQDVRSEVARHSKAIPGYRACWMQWLTTEPTRRDDQRRPQASGQRSQFC